MMAERGVWMKYQKFVLFVLLLCMLPVTAFANSSWVWLSETRPYDVLPFVALLTIAMETAAIWLALERQHLAKIAVVVVIANLLSFATPYLLMYWEMKIEDLKSFTWLMTRGHYFTVGTAFLLMTLLVEVPVVFLTLRKHAVKKGRFLLTAIGANVVTTLITAAAERIFCYGQW